MANSPLFVVVIATAFNMSAQTGSIVNSKRATNLANDTLVEGWQTGDVLTSLIRVAATNKIALGIVVEGDSLCRNSVSGSSGSIRISSLIDQVQTQASNYTVEIRNDTVYAHPKVMKASTTDALELRIPRFISEPTNKQELGISLWMYIRGVLVPQETSTFSGGLQSNAEKLPAINLANLSVHDILDHVITLGQGGVWIMYEVPAGWQANPKTKPYEIWSYSSGGKIPDHLLKCPEATN